MAKTANITVRFDTKGDLALVKRAAKLRDMSLNKYIIRTTVATAQDELKGYQAGEAAEQALTQ